MLALSWPRRHNSGWSQVASRPPKATQSERQVHWGRWTRSPSPLARLEHRVGRPSDRWPRSSRIVEVDIIRGFALFGVLLVNMYGFGADSIAWSSPADQLAFARHARLLRVEIVDALLAAVRLRLRAAARARRRDGALHPPALPPAAGRALRPGGRARAALRRRHPDALRGARARAPPGAPPAHARPPPPRRRAPAGLSPGPTRLATELTTGPDEMRERRAQLERAQRSDVYAIGSLAEVAADNASAIPANPLEDVATPESGLAVFAMFLLGFSIGRSGFLRDIPGNAAALRARAGLGSGSRARSDGGGAGSGRHRRIRGVPAAARRAGGAARRRSALRLRNHGARLWAMRRP